ncbi:hypothetical protein B0H17DRAFT_1338728 [Mycena rosella]|uniref:DUF6532 domain-containing protein n=1 Tax=Mycena rosella TaxID=1033263 RepID=A0AAD7CI63_MYCRO|nr:hypothetical protein B0H17DRAFT_1338728 [Mycena rosella]
MANQSKLASPATHSRTKSAPKVAAATARSRAADKENNDLTQSSRRTVPTKQRLEEEDEYEEYEDEEEENSLSVEDGDDGCNSDVDDGDAPAVAKRRADQVSDDDDEEHPVRAARTRRVSEKEAQRLADKEEAAARKTSRATNAVKRQRRRERGESPVPLEDSVFTSRDVEPLPKKVKTLQQRDTRVPAMQARAIATEQPLRGRTREPMQDLRYIIASRQAEAGPSRHSGARPEAFDSPRRGLASRSISDWRHSAVAPRPTEIDEEPRPRSINGNVFPERVQLDLHSGSSSSRPQPSTTSANDSRLRQKPVQRREPRVRSESRSPSRSPAPGDKPIIKGRPRAKDYDDTAQELISIANTWYQCLLATQDAFPGSTAEPKMVNLAWDTACEELKVAVRLTPDIAKLIMRRGSQMRGELKTKVRALVELIFGFESGQNKKIIRKNRQRAEDLKEGMGYSYKEFPDVAAQRKGIFKGPIIQSRPTVCGLTAAATKGPCTPSCSDLCCPKPTLALVLTAIECSVDDFHSGAQPISAVKKAGISSAVLEAAILEYDEDENTESDGEDGERSDA